jgi:hypothetical protein
MGAYPPDMGERVRQANDLSLVLRTAPRTDRPLVPEPADPTPDATALRLAAAELQADDFKGLLHTLRTRHPIAHRASV